MTLINHSTLLLKPDKMELLNKVKDELEKDKGFDFSSEMWTSEMLTLLYDAVYTTEKVLKTNQ